MDRKLAAILAADVVGYSAMMERDEVATHDRVRASRKELFEPTIARHHGAIFKLMGDGLLAEFSSVVEAMERIRRCPSSDNLRLIRHFEKRGSGSSGLEFKRPAVGAASGGLRWWQA
jgi:class 3 adenylate cyclase